MPRRIRRRGCRCSSPGSKTPCAPCGRQQRQRQRQRAGGGPLDAGRAEGPHGPGGRACAGRFRRLGGAQCHVQGVSGISPFEVEHFDIFSLDGSDGTITTMEECLQSVRRLEGCTRALEAAEAARAVCSEALASAKCMETNCPAGYEGSLLAEVQILPECSKASCSSTCQCAESKCASVFVGLCRGGSAGSCNR